MDATALPHARRAMGTIDLPGDSFRIGIRWSGKLATDRDIPLELMMSLAENPRVQLYSFQMGGNSDIARVGASDLLYDFEPLMSKGGWVSTGLCMSEMDLIVTNC